MERIKYIWSQGLNGHRFQTYKSLLQKERDKLISMTIIGRTGGYKFKRNSLKEDLDQILGKPS